MSEPFMNLIQEGERKHFDAPAGGVTAGDVFLVEDALVCALETADAGDPVLCAVDGVVANVPADDTASSGAFDDYQVVYWNDTDGKLYADTDGGTGTGHPDVGRAWGAKVDTAAKTTIKLS